MPPDPRGSTNPTASDVEAVAEQVFTALADPTRRAILAALVSQGPATATDLAIRLPITRQGIAKHLVLLAEAGLVAAEPGSGAGCATGCARPRCRSRSSSWPRWPATGMARSAR
jgi:predicted HTH transcriptional regulator